MSPKNIKHQEETAQLATGQRIANTLLQHVKGLFEDSGASTILICSQGPGNDPFPLEEKLRKNVLYAARTDEDLQGAEALGYRCIRVPDVTLSRMGQVKMATFLALSRGLIEQDDVIVSLSGISQSGVLDTLVILEVGAEYEMLTHPTESGVTPAHIQPEVLERAIDLASQMGSEGREGIPVGAIFVIGDSERVISLSRQLILNPFHGYPEEQRNLLDPTLEETIKELSSLDGAFVVRGDGIVETCGAYLKTASQDEVDLPRGLGARHHAAAAITAVTDAMAVTVSQSTGTVSIFRSGHIVTEIEKPRLAGC